MLKHTKWSQRDYNQEKISEIKNNFNISTSIAKILLNRGLEDMDAIDRYLNVKLKNLEDPFLLLNMDKTVEAIIDAMNNNKIIYGFGDYDVDGTTSLSILYLFLVDVYKEENVHYLIPNRKSSGYGLNNEAIDFIKGQGGDLIITVDCGISNYDEVEYANSIGVDVIVVDHHQIPTNIPNAKSILNPYLIGNKTLFKDMAAVGVTFNLLLGLRKSLRELGHFKNRPEPDLKTYLDLVALGTVADIVPLLEENRIFVKIGFKEMAHTKNYGLRALMEISGVSPPLDTTKVSFKIAPRINAAGRMSDANKVVELFTTKSYEKALEIAKILDEENTQRQQIERGIYLEIVSKIENQRYQGTAIIMANESWHPGVIGIVAAKIVEKYNRPTFLFSISDGIARGSSRSINNFDLYETLSRHDELFINYGGHKYAAGLSIDMKNFKEFEKAMQKEANDFFADPDNLMHEIKIDDILNVNEVSIGYYNIIKRLSPFGNRNPEPVFGMRNLFPTDAQIVGERHLRLKLSSRNRKRFRAMGFNKSHLLKKTSSYVDILFSLQVNDWKGRRHLQLNLKDLKKYDENNFN